MHDRYQLKQKQTLDLSTRLDELIQHIRPKQRLNTFTMFGKSGQVHIQRVSKSKLIQHLNSPLPLNINHPTHTYENKFNNPHNRPTVHYASIIKNSPHETASRSALLQSEAYPIPFNMRQRPPGQASGEDRMHRLISSLGTTQEYKWAINVCGIGRVHVCAFYLCTARRLAGGGDKICIVFYVCCVTRQLVLLF